MTAHRFFLTDGTVGSTDMGPFALPLDEADLHHAIHVLRVRPGEELVVVEHGGDICRVRVERVESDALFVSEVDRSTAPAEPHVTLVQGLAKGDKMDFVVEKAVEAGVERIFPAAFERSVVKLDADRTASRLERWQRVASAAAKQSGRSRVPHVGPLLDFSGVVEAVSSADVALVAWEEEASAAPGIGTALRDAGATQDSVIVVIVGPEGGITHEEASRLIAAGAVVVSLGANMIRTETAGILSVALCVYESGGLGGRSRG